MQRKTNNKSKDGNANLREYWTIQVHVRNSTRVRRRRVHEKRNKKRREKTLEKQNMPEIRRDKTKLTNRWTTSTRGGACLERRNLFFFPEGHDDGTRPLRLPTRISTSGRLQPEAILESRKRRRSLNAGYTLARLSVSRKMGSTTCRCCPVAAF